MTGCRSPAVGNSSACADFSRYRSAIDLAIALYAESLCCNVPTSEEGACIHSVVDMGSVRIGKHDARVFIVRRRIIGMEATRGMTTVEVVSSGMNRIASFRTEQSSKIKLEEAGLLRIGDLPPIHLKDLVGFDTAFDLIAKSNAAEWSRQVVAAVMDAYLTHGLEPLLSDPLPALLRPSVHAYWHQGLRNIPVIEPSSSSALVTGKISLPQQIYRYTLLEISASDIATPSLRYSKYWESTVRVQVWEGVNTQTPLILEFAVLGDSQDSDLVESIRLVRVLK